MKIVFGRTAALIALVCLAGGPASAQDGASGSDARCLAAMSLLHDSAKAADKGALESSMMFFLGKLVGRGGNAAVGPAIESGAAGMTAESAAEVADKCADELTAATNAM